MDPEWIQSRSRVDPEWIQSGSRVDPEWIDIFDLSSKKKLTFKLGGLKRDFKSYGLNKTKNNIVFKKLLNFFFQF